MCVWCMYSDGVMVYSRGGCDHFRDKGWYLLRCGAMYCLESLGGGGGGLSSTGVALQPDKGLKNIPLHILVIMIN